MRQKKFAYFWQLTFDECQGFKSYFPGLIQGVIDRALEKQFNDYLVSKNIDPDTASAEEIQKQQDAYTADLYPGASTSPKSMVNVLVADDPSETIKSKELTDPGSNCVDVPSSCDNPWFQANKSETFQGFTFDKCFANFGKSKANEDECLNSGGSTIYFEQFGSLQNELYYLMSEGNLFLHCE